MITDIWKTWQINSEWERRQRERNSGASWPSGEMDGKREQQQPWWEPDVHEGQGKELQNSAAQTTLQNLELMQDDMIKGKWEADADSETEDERKA